MAGVDKKKLTEFMKSMGGAQPNREQMKIMGELSSKYGDKNEADIKTEMKKLKAEMMKDQKKFKQQMEAVEGMKGFLDEDQKRKLENILEFLNADQEE